MIAVKEITKAYGVGESKVNVLKGITVNIKDGSFTVILGASGSGKSTLLNIMSGLEKPDSGEILYDGSDIARLPEDKLTRFRRDRVGFIFQQYYLLPDMDVDKNVKMGAELSGNKDYRSLIEAVGLGAKLHKYPGELSGGEQQRVSVARALAKRPGVLFLDEPTGALDEQNGRNVLSLVSSLREEYKFTIVMVTHNQNIAQMADTVIKINSGEICEIYENHELKTASQIGW